MIPSRGVTLVELMVVLALLGVVAGVAGVALQSTSRVPENDALAIVTAARTEALRTGRPVTVEVRLDGRPRAVTAWPDGSVIADESLGVDRLTGRRSDAVATARR
jgi:prepilin-type N-terminal cleavage/methylation domain-containing protein